MVYLGPLSDHPRVVGLDVSLTSTGMSDGSVTQVVQTTSDDTVEDRMNQVMDGIRNFVRGPSIDPTLVVIEAGAFARGSQSAAAEYLSALRYMTRCYLRTHGIPFAMVAPTTLKLYTTGNGRATKAHMVKAVRDRHGVDFGAFTLVGGRYDRADAFALAALGYARIGYPLMTVGDVPPVHLVRAQWPELITD